MTLIRWHRAATPQFSPFHAEINRLFGTPEVASRADEQAPQGSVFAPALDVVETAEGYEFSVDVPGLQAEDIHIELSEGTLTLSGERAERTLAEGDKALRTERRVGAFSRSLSLPEDVDPEGVTAECDAGVLVISVAKKEATLPRRIEVKAR